MTLKHLRSSTADKRPQASGMADGQLAINTASGSPGLFFKDTNGSIVKIGPVHVGSGAPNASPASGGTTGNSLGEQWLDTSNGNYVFKIWDGGEWRSETGEFVNASGDTMTGSLVLGSGASLVFEGSTDDGFETTLTVVDPTADRTITLPNVNGTVVTTGDTGTVTSTMLLDGTIVNADVNASAAIAGTKISPDFGGQTITTSGIVSVASGSAAAPSIAINGDANTGIYSPGADQLAISTNGTGRLFVNSSGSVGIGTSNATGKLGIAVSGTRSLGAVWDDKSVLIGNPAQFGANLGLSFDTTNGATIESAAPGSSFYPVRVVGSEIQLFTSTSERLRIDSSGRVGIGTSTVDRGGLHVANYVQQGSSTPYDNFAFLGPVFNNFGTSASNPATILVGSLNATKDSAIIFGGGDLAGSLGSGWAIRHAKSSGAGALAFSTHGGTGAGSETERLRINSAGQINVASLGSAASPAIVVGNDINSGIYSPGADQVAISTNGTGQLIVRSNGDIEIPSATQKFVNSNGVGAFSIASGFPEFPLSVTGLNVLPRTTSLRGLAITGLSGQTGDLFNASNNAGTPLVRIEADGTISLRSGNYIRTTQAEDLRFGTNSTERLRIDSSGRLLVGTSSARANLFNLASTGSPLLQIEGTTLNTSSASIIRSSADAQSSWFVLGKNRGATVGSNTIVQAEDNIGILSFQASDGAEFTEAAQIYAVVDGTPGLNDMPGRLVFSTTADGANSPTERLRITSAGLVGIGTSAPGTLLHLAGNNTGTTGNSPVATIRLEDTDGSTSDDQPIGKIEFYGNDSTTPAVGVQSYIISRAVSTSGGGYLEFGTRPNGGASADPRMRIDGSGRLLVGTSSSIGGALLQVADAAGNCGRFYGSSTATAGTYLVLGRSNGTLASPTVSVNNDVLGAVYFDGYNGSSFIGAASIKAEVDGVVSGGGANDMPGRLVFSTTADGASSPTERMRITNGGNVNIGSGTSTPARLLHLSDTTGQPAIKLSNNTSGHLSGDGADLTFTGTDLYATNREAGAVILETNGAERARIDSSGRLLVGTSSARTNLLDGTRSASFQTEGTVPDNSCISVIRNAASIGQPSIYLGKTRGATVGSNTVVVAEDGLGNINFLGADGTNLIAGASIGANVDGTPGTNDMPGRLVFSTTADGASSPTERMRISNAGTTTLTSAASTAPFIANIGASEVARLDSSGRLLVGTSSARSNFNNSAETSPLQIEGTSANTAGAALIHSGANTFPAVLQFAKQRSGTVGGNTIVQAEDVAGFISFEGSDGSEFVRCAAIGAVIDGTPGANDMPGRLVFSTTADGASSPTERMRISSTGTISTSQALSTTTVFSIRNSSNTSSQTLLEMQGGTYTTSDTTTKLIVFKRGDGTEIGSVIRNGATTVNYATSSDYRLKENIKPLTGALAKFNTLKPSRFNFIGDTRTVDGFIAHEVQPVVPEAITGEKDAVDEDGNPIYQGIDQSKLVPLLTAALQEAIAKIESLEARLTAAGI